MKAQAKVKAQILEGGNLLNRKATAGAGTADAIKTMQTFDFGMVISTCRVAE